MVFDVDESEKTVSGFVDPEMTYAVHGDPGPGRWAMLWAACKAPAVLSVILAVFVVGVTAQPRAIILVLMMFLVSSLANLVVGENASH